jgi:TonB family protein
LSCLAKGLFQLMVHDLTNWMGLVVGGWGMGWEAHAPRMTFRSMGSINPPSPRFQVKPVYSFYMRMSGVEGRVLVRFNVDKKGEVFGAYAGESSHPGFRQSAVDAVERWRFRPGKREGKPVAVYMTVPIVFNFDDGAGAAQGWTVTRPEKHPDNLPESLKRDEAPQLLVFNPPVYPRSSVIGKEKGKVTVQFITSPDGGVVLAKAVVASSPELAGAAVDSG